MSDQLTINRRRVLELSGVGTGLAIAGCTGQLDDNGLAGDERRVTISLPEQGALQELEIEIQQQMQAGELTQQEAQAEFQQRQEELLDDAFNNIQAEFEELNITIEDTVQNQILLVAGPATELIDALDIQGVGGLLSSDAFERVQEQQGAQEQQETQEQQATEQPDEEELEGFQVRIIYEGQWSGAAGAEGNTRTIQGEGDTIIDVDDDANIISANAQKQDDSNRELTIQILEDGEVVAEQSTTSGFGIAQVSHDNFGF